MGEPVRGKAIDDAIGVAELVIEPGPDHALRQGVLDVADLLAVLIPDVRDLLGANGALYVDENGRLAGRRVAAQVVEVWRFVQLALKALGDLQQRVVQGRAGPRRLHDHRLDGERGVFAAAQCQLACWIETTAVRAAVNMISETTAS